MENEKLTCIKTRICDTPTCGSPEICPQRVNLWLGVMVRGKTGSVTL